MRVRRFILLLKVHNLLLNIIGEQPLEAGIIKARKARRNRQPVEETQVTTYDDHHLYTHKTICGSWIQVDSRISTQSAFLQYCIVSKHLYSASCSAHQSEALPVQETQREESSNNNRAQINQFRVVYSSLVHSIKCLWCIFPSFRSQLTSENLFSYTSIAHVPLLVHQLV